MQSEAVDVTRSIPLPGCWVAAHEVLALDFYLATGLTQSQQNVSSCEDLATPSTGVAMGIAVEF